MLGGNAWLVTHYEGDGREGGGNRNSGVGSKGYGGEGGKG